MSGYLRFGSIPKRIINHTYKSGQAMVEFALIASIALIVLLVGIQFAIIGQAALAVSQGSYYAARYAAVQTTINSSAALQNAVSGQFSPTITSPSGALWVNMTTNSADPSCSPRGFGCTIQVTVGYNATSKIVLGTGTSFFGISFPSQLNSTHANDDRVTTLSGYSINSLVSIAGQLVNGRMGGAI